MKPNLLQDLQSKLDRADQLEEFLVKLGTLIDGYLEVLDAPKKPAGGKGKKRRRLTPLEIKSVRKLLKRNVGIAEIATQFKISTSAIGNIKAGRSHSNIK